MKNTPLRLVLLLASPLLFPGCASVFLSGHDDLKVVTDPPGAIARVGEQAVVTPGVLKVPRDAKPVVVEILKEGYERAEVPIRRTRTGAVWTNVVGISAGAALSAFASVFCWSSECRNEVMVPLIVGAGVTAAGLAVDFSTRRTLRLERNDLALRMEPVRLAKAREGDSR